VAWPLEMRQTCDDMRAALCALCVLTGHHGAAAAHACTAPGAAQGARVWLRRRPPQRGQVFGSLDGSLPQRACDREGPPCKTRCAPRTPVPARLRAWRAKALTRAAAPQDSSEGENEQYQYGVCAMQGWRTEMVRTHDIALCSLRDGCRPWREAGGGPAATAAPPTTALPGAAGGRAREGAPARGGRPHRLVRRV